MNESPAHIAVVEKVVLREKFSTEYALMDATGDSILAREINMRRSHS